MSVVTTGPRPTKKEDINMATTFHYASGIAQWAKVFEHNKDVYLEEERYAIDLVMNEEEAQKFKNTGSRLRPKVSKNEDGEVQYTVKFRRDVTHRIPEFGGPPRVVDVENKDITDLIGNGSKVTIKYCVYDTKMGKGTRLEAVRVDELVRYVRDPNGFAGATETNNNKNPKDLPF
jgi:hypothetical protein